LKEDEGAHYNDTDDEYDDDSEDDEDDEDEDGDKDDLTKKAKPSASMFPEVSASCTADLLLFGCRYLRKTDSKILR